MIYEISVPIAFVAGLISFFAPCVIPLLPVYVGYISGVSFSELKKNNYLQYRRKIIFSSLFYVLGFSVLFVLTGTAAAGVGAYFAKYRGIIHQLGGLLIIIMGLEFAGILNISKLSQDRHLRIPEWAEKLGYFRAFLVGVIFAAAWSPCIGPVYGTILSLAAVSGTALQGAKLLFIYSLGISIPFLAVTLTLASAPKYLKVINRHMGKITKISGVLMIILGIMLFTNTYRFINAWVLSFAFKLGYQIR